MRTLLAALMLCVSVMPAGAHYAGPETDLSAWYAAQHNGHGQFCCDKSDGHQFDGDYKLDPNGDVEFDAEGQHYHLPEYMVLKGTNPTGHAVWWHLGDPKAEYVTSFCFATGSGA